MANYKVCIDPGHGGYDFGASFNDLREKDVVLEVSKDLARLLGVYPIDLLFTRDSDVYIPLAMRCKMANQYKSDLFLSIHCNADPDPDLPGMPEATGAEIWYHASSKKSEALSTCLANAFKLLLPGEPFRGLKPTTNLYVLKHTNMPAALVEIGFIDNSDTNEKLRDVGMIRTISGILALGITKYFDTVS